MKISKIYGKFTLGKMEDKIAARNSHTLYYGHQSPGAQIYLLEKTDSWISLKTPFLTGTSVTSSKKGTYSFVVSPLQTRRQCKPP